MNLRKKFTSVALAATTFVWLSGATMIIPVANAATTQETIDSLMATITALTAQINALQGGGVVLAGAPSGFTFTSDLTVGSKGADVKVLQQFLNSNGYPVAASGAGSVGNESTYFGTKTKAALAKYQEANGIKPSVGYFGPKTRAWISSVVVAPVTPVTTLPAGCTSATGFSPTTGQPCSTGTPITQAPVSGLAVALASDNPVSGTVVAGQAIADLAHFTFTGSGTVTSLKLKRIGVSADATLSNVYLYDGKTRLTDTATASNGVLTFANIAGLFTVSGSRTISVKSDILTGSTGQTVGVALLAATDVVSTGGVTVGGVFPINGNTMTVATATLATVAVGNVTPSAVTSVNAGTNNYTVFSAPLTIGTRSVSLSNIALKLIGSVTNDALINLKLYVNGTQAGSPVSVDASGNVIFDLATPVVIQSGSATLEVRADIVKGSARNFSFSLQNVADLVVIDTNYNVNVAATGIPATTAVVSVNSGSVTVSLNPNFSVTTVTGGISNATLAKYSFKAYGEDVKISYLDVTPSVNLDNVAIYANSASITNSQNYIGTKLHFSLGSSLIIPANTVVSVEVRGDTKAAGVNITTGTILITLNGYTNNAQGVNSLSLSTVPSLTGQAGQSLTVNTGGLILAKTSGFLDQPIVANTANQKVGSFVIQAGSSEAVKINNLSVVLGGTLAVSNLSNLYIKYGSTSATPINPQATNNFSVDITLQPNTSVTVEVFADVGSVGTVVNTNTTPQTLVTNNAATTAANGVQSSQTATYTGTASTTQTTVITVAGFPSSVPETTGNSATQEAAAMVTVFNANTNVNGQFIASNLAGVLTIKGKVAGTSLNGTTITKTVGTGNVVTLGGATLTGGTNNTAQISTVTPANVEIGDVFTAGIGATSVSFTATAATVANVTAGLTAAWNANATLAAIAAATDGTTVVNLTAVVSGTAGAFTAVSSAANGSHSATGSTVQVILSMSATGVTSNSTVASSPTSVAGQTMTIAVGSLATPTLVSAPASPVAQFVLGGTTATVATLNFVATAGTATIQELRFTISGSATTPISQITVGSVTAPVVASVATVSGLSISVPVGYAGTNVAVIPTYNSVGLNGVLSNTTTTVTLTYVKSIVGSVTTETAPSVAAATMTLVASKPSLVIGPATVSGLTNGQVKLADVTVMADAAGNIKLEQLPIIVTGTGVVSITTGTDNIVVKDSTGTVIPSTNTTFVVTAGGGTSGSVPIVITTPFNIPAGTSKVFSIYATAATVSGAVNTTSLSTKLGTNSDFKWTDVNGNVTGITGTQIYNYPTNTSVITN